MSKTVIVTGVYGSGKTEFCVNYALSLRKRTRERIYIADLDVVNPYFRSREKIACLRQFDIAVLGDSLPEDRGKDIPAVNFGFLPLVERGEAVIVDLAGGKAGLNLLAGLYERIRAHAFLCVLNLYRPETRSAEQMIHFIEELHRSGKLRVTGLVNNSHMLRETEPAHVLNGQEVILSVSEKLGIPLQYTQLQEAVYRQISAEIQSDEVLLFRQLQMREKWQ